MNTARVFAYGLLGAPLAAAALPIYIHIPKLYAEHYGVSLTLLGVVLFAARLVDALADPLIGAAGDRARGRRVIVLLGLLPLAVGLPALVKPLAGIDPLLWLVGALLLVYAGYSIATINYSAWGAELSTTPALGTRLVASREGWALVGVVAASVAPGLLADDAPTGLWRAALYWLPWLALAALLTTTTVPDQRPQATAQPLLDTLREVMRHQRFRRLLAVFALNGIAAAVPGTLVLFFIADVLQAPEREGLFLALYFVAGVLALPLWTRLADRIGRARSWAASMLLAIVVFGWAWTLGPGDATAFMLICVGSGIALGADLALPPALLAGLIARREEPLPAGGSFGVWTFVTKLNLALAAGVALPALALLGYRPGEQGDEARAALTAVYALLPLLLKAAALCLLWAGTRRLEPDLQGASS
ncbi:MFS transporter [Methyloversatilis discipulorum]|uniref:MFS transporter n=1 Tax=Methyloversatilis discipulorum TaxID=1119528 RepID=UPI001A3CFA29|nr:MFS transporter [Methyloversatilis discipulorum]MBL8468762.1 MFS transporter [Methyloversatilis discipulorum]